MRQSADAVGGDDAHAAVDAGVRGAVQVIDADCKRRFGVSERHMHADHVRHAASRVHFELNMATITHQVMPVMVYHGRSLLPAA